MKLKHNTKTKDAYMTVCSLPVVYIYRLSKQVFLASYVLVMVITSIYMYMRYALYAYVCMHTCIYIHVHYT